MTFPKPYADRVAKLRVPFGFALVACFALFGHPTTESLAFGLPLALVGLLLRAWAAGNLIKDGTLTTTGPYSLVRNPLYVGTTTVAAGFAIASANWALAALFSVVFLFIYLPVIALEEQHLRDLFPSFPSYAAEVPRLLPRHVWGPNTARFDSRLYHKNREYEAGLGFLVGVALLAGKAFLRL